MQTPSLSVNFEYPTASKADISSWRDCTNIGSLSARPPAASSPFIPSPGYAKTCSTPHFRSRANTASATVILAMSALSLIETRQCLLVSEHFAEHVTLLRQPGDERADGVPVRAQL